MVLAVLNMSLVIFPGVVCAMTAGEAKRGQAEGSGWNLRTRINVFGAGGVARWGGRGDTLQHDQGQRRVLGHDLKTTVQYIGYHERLLVDVSRSGRFKIFQMCPSNDAPTQVK